MFQYRGLLMHKIVVTKSDQPVEKIIVGAAGEPK
jgi:hypothetical protein